MSEGLPEGFVYLRDIDASIQQSIRYASCENFIGRVIPGYNPDRSSIILTKSAAVALQRVQEEVRKDGYNLVVYDAYRPQKAVNEFYAWSQVPEDALRKEQYYPYVDKEKVFELGYIAERSGHTRGSTVDLTLIETGKVVAPVPSFSLRQFSDVSERAIPFLDDNTVDMGSSFDLMDEASHHDSAIIPAQYLRMRNYLKDKMREQGFADYDQEWWHYNLLHEPFPDTYFDFNVE